MEEKRKKEGAGGEGGSKKRSFERGLANIYKLLFELTLLSGFRPLPIYYFFCSKDKHRVLDDGSHRRIRGAKETLEGGKEQEPARSRKQRKHKILPLEADPDSKDKSRMTCFVVHSS